MNVLLPTVAGDLNAGSVAAQWIMLSYWMAVASCMVAFGRISDVWGRKGVFCAGLLVFSLASGLASFSTNAMELIALRILQGIAAAAIFANTSALVAQVYAGPKLGSALGHLALVAALAQAAGPGIGAWMATHWGWRSTLVAPSVAGALLSLTAGRLLTVIPHANAGDRSRVDVISALLVGCALSLMCWSLTQLGRPVLPSADGYERISGPLGAITAAGAVLWLLWRRLNVVDHPLISPALLRDALAQGVYLSTFTVALVQQGPLIVLALYLQTDMGMSMTESGWHLSGMAFGMMLGALCAGPCARIFPPQRVCLLAMGGILAALAVVLLCVRINAPLGLMFALAALGFGVAMYVTPSNQLLMQGCPPEHRGVVNALRATVQNTGMLSGIGLVMVLSSLALPPEWRSLAHVEAMAADAGAGRPTMWLPVWLSLASLSVAVFAGLIGVRRAWCRKLS